VSGRRAVLLVLAVGLLAPEVAAHDRSVSYSSWTIRGRRAHVRAQLTRLEVSRFPWAAGEARDVARRLGAHLTQRLRLVAGGEPCRVTDGPQVLEPAPGRVAAEWRLRCPAGAPLALRGDLFAEVLPTHLHFARVRWPDGREAERVLSQRDPMWRLAGPSTSEGAAAEQASFGGWARLGVEHVLTGADHLVFLAALLLIGGSLGQVAGVVTGFTVAHRITLGLATVGLARPDAAGIEALIGLSIALVAVENVWLLGPRRAPLPALLTGLLGIAALVGAAGHGTVPAATLAGLAVFVPCYFALLGRVARAAALRWAIAFVFGLVHGFGFAAVLIEAALPPGRLGYALLGFNLGVEAGQLAAVAALWPLLRLAAAGGRRVLVVEAGSAAVLALGLFWFVTRAYG
jgi:hypothetical protein